MSLNLKVSASNAVSKHKHAKDKNKIIRVTIISSKGSSKQVMLKFLGALHKQTKILVQLGYMLSHLTIWCSKNITYTVSPTFPASLLIGYLYSGVHEVEFAIPILK